ncbi:hypothetical protein NBO_2g0056 [Nosema bombycis CQ1]|uniref:Uncharacterized protein n=1 Tax=Nosema bombycis (strain CQ1 / CVCC 102059) TaxID=578461 RepID=R0MMV0_NOSB1|nr:hypothetical protein NBO_2g0056 [Nosema bombycis CQ1]|eukprot:EOB15565.1 hypothetical protein NBO_2g0056 [Nosema bombycis CQ1]
MKQILILIFISVIRNGSTKSKPEEQVDENPQTSETKIEFPTAKPFNTLQELMNNIKEEYNINSEYESDEIQNEEGFGYIPPTNLLYYRAMDDSTSHTQTINSEMQNKNIQEKSQNIPTDEEHKNDSQDVTNESKNITVEVVSENSSGKNLMNNNHQLQNHKHEAPVDKTHVSGSILKRKRRSRIANTGLNNELYPKKLLQNRKNPIVKKTSFYRKKINEPKAKKLGRKWPQKRYKRTKDEDFKESRHEKKSKNDKLKKIKKTPKSKSKDNTLKHALSMFNLTQGDDPNAYLALHESDNTRPNSDFKIDSDKSPKAKPEVDGVKSEINVRADGCKPIDNESKVVSIKPGAVKDSIQPTKTRTPINITQSAQPHNIIKLNFNISKTKI